MAAPIGSRFDHDDETLLCCTSFRGVVLPLYVQVHVEDEAAIGRTSLAVQANPIHDRVIDACQLRHIGHLPLARSAVGSMGRHRTVSGRDAHVLRPWLIQHRVTCLDIEGVHAVWCHGRREEGRVRLEHKQQ